MQTPGTSADQGGSAPPFNPVVDPDPTEIVDPDLESGADAVDAGGDEDAAAREAEAHEAEAQPEARKHGWVPREEWRGPPERWRPASEFMEVRNGMLNVAREENSQLRAKLAVLETRLNTREQTENEARAKLTRESLRLELKNAQENNDWDRVTEITEKMMDSRIAAVAPPQPTQVQIAPEVKETFDNFASTNKWLTDDKRLAANFAIELKAVVEAKATGDMHTAMELAKDRVMRMYPDKFRSNGSRPRTSMVDMGGNPGGSTNGRSWSDLLPATRRMAEADVAAKRYSKEEFLSNCGPEDFRR